MSDAAMRMDVAQVQGSLSSGWLISVVLHGGVVALAMQAVMDIKPHLQPETFRWEVALHEAPAPSPVASDALPPQESVSEAALPQPCISLRCSSLPRLRCRRTVERTGSRADGSARAIHSKSDGTIAPQERQAVVTEVRTLASYPVLQTVVAHAQEVVQQDIHETAQTSDGPMVTAQSSATVIHEAASVVEAQTTTPEQPAIVGQSVVQPEVRMATTSAPVGERHDPVESEPVVVYQEAVEHRVVRETAPAQADLGWLSESLWKRIEQLKRYPRQARARRWEGKVVLEAVIRHDGTILECLVAESSGHGLLDQDAISVLRKASPLALKHPLGKEQITILVPIAYRLES